MTTWPFPEDADDGGPPLRGRAAELAFIEARLDALARGEGGVVLVEGPAGSGKSRVLGEASASARRRGTRVFQGGADPEEQFVPLGPLLDGLLTGAAPLSDAARLRDLATVPGQRFWLLQELGDRLREAARTGPLLIVLDDLQWCDELTLLTLHTLSARLAPDPILWLVAVCGDSVPPRVRTTLDRIHRGGARAVVLEPLDERAVARIVEDVLGAAPGPDVLRVARRAEGVPLLLRELLDVLRDEEVVTIENGTARLTAAPLPARPLPSVGRRIGLLSDAARELVETAAAVGRPVTVSLLAELLGSTPAALITPLREALDTEWLAESGDRLEFRNDLVRASVAAGLPLPVRRSLRGRAARALPDSEAAVSTHPGPPAAAPEPDDRTGADSRPDDRTGADSRADDRTGADSRADDRTGADRTDDYRTEADRTDDDRASADSRDNGRASADRTDDDRTEAERTDVDRLRTAAADIAATAPGPAAELALRALELTAADAPERPRVIAEAIPLLWQTGQAARARELGTSALSTGGLGPRDEARIRLGLARLSTQYDFSEAVRQARAGAALPGLPTDLRARLLALLCLGHALTGDNEAAEQALPEARETAEAAGDRAARATLTVVASAVRFRRMDWSEALRLAEPATALGAADSLWVPEGLWQSFVLNAAGRSDQALAVTDAALRQAREQGRTAATRMWRTHRARILLDTGRLTDARAEAEAASATPDDPGPDHLADVTRLYVLTRVAVHTNDQRAARRYTAAALRMRADGAPLVRRAGAWTLASLADFEGRADAAAAVLADVVSALDEERPSQGGPLDPADAPGLVRVALRAGAHDAALRAVGAAERRAALNPGVTLLAATAAHARGLLDNDLDHLVRAVRLYEDTSRPLARASALEDTGRKLAATRRAEAVPYLDEALGLYVRAGAERDVARVRRRLRAAGVRRRPAPAGHLARWPELTASELGVARLVAQGLTNRQVAERLSVSPHTVSSHLRRAFTKLDLTSRAELTRLVRTRDSGE
ncbi:Putative HTH-type transcriptional regulator [Streptomyces sp. YIM 121038]|uniref:helix-turn-helix transcriptional regulator n=1 Tax=Streptomyces sp. YIM 121038 TaxID=2136401 RepID=UPI0011109A79|nr:LuxR family transcriptional regulator [Streptomyces sp. YIM 121038]QCX74154.1 Putative HTH-type transcriptional regulator [Streptomyces sp. YIM 121038]